MAQFMDDVLRAFQMGQGIESNRMQMSAQRQNMQDDAIKREQQAIQANDYRVAEQEMAQGRPDVMQLGFPEQYREIQTKDLANQSTQMKMNEDRQQIRDKALEQGLTAASANPANWSKFVDYVERNKVYDPGELDRNMTQEQAQMALGKLKTARERATNPNQKFENTIKLKSSLESQPMFKALQTTEGAFLKMNGAPDTLPGQMGLVFGLMKLLDEGSVVRETEQAQVIAATGLPGRLQNYMTSLEGGRSLNATQVQEIKDAAANLAQAYRTVYSKFATPYRKMAETYGLNPDEVVMPYGFEGDIRGNKKQTQSMMSPEQEKQLIQIVESGKSVDDALQEMGLTQ